MGRWNFFRLWSSTRAPNLSPRNVDAFLSLMAQSGLASEAELHEAIADFSAASKTANALDDLSAHLISKGLLTSWQSDKLKSGKFKGFYLDGYCLLGQIGKTDRLCIYSAREVSTGRLVALDITPLKIDPIQDGRIHYEVREISEDPKSGEA